MLDYASVNYLDIFLGPDWDLYLMSLLFVVIVWLFYSWYRNQQMAAGIQANQAN